MSTSRLALILDALRGSFWFLPALLTLAAATLAVGLLVADARLPSATVRSVGWIYTGGAQGARSLLATVAGAVVTVVYCPLVLRSVRGGNGLTDDAFVPTWR